MTTPPPPSSQAGKLDFTEDPWPSVSAGAKDLIRKLLEKDVSKRLTAEVRSPGRGAHVITSFLLETRRPERRWYARTLQSVIMMLLVTLLQHDVSFCFFAACA